MVEATVTPSIESLLKITDETGPAEEKIRSMVEK
jgi:hypothetical protein